MIYLARSGSGGGDILGYLTWNGITQVLAIIPQTVLLSSEKDKWLQLSLLGWRIIRRKALPR